MIIVSQIKNSITNFDNVTNIEIDEFEDGFLIKCQILNKTHVNVGFYKTEERAKEVLQEIIKKYSSYLELKGGPAVLQGQIDIQPNIFNVPKIYEMPLE